jgi:hypothetical protein
MTIIRPYSDQLKSRLLFGGNAWDHPDDADLILPKPRNKLKPFLYGLVVGMLTMSVLWYIPRYVH